MTGAGEALVAVAMARLAAIGGLTGSYAGRPLQAAHPFATLDAGLETDWSHKTGAGREVRLSILLHDKGERQDRLRRLMAEAESGMAGIDPDLGGWRIASLAFLRSRVAGGPGEGWTGILDYRARMLSVPDG